MLASSTHFCVNTYVHIIIIYIYICRKYVYILILCIYIYITMYCYEILVWGNTFTNTFTSTESLQHSKGQWRSVDVFVNDVR